MKSNKQLLLCEAPKCIIIGYSNTKPPLNLRQLEPSPSLGLKNSPSRKFFPLFFTLLQKKNQGWQLLIILFLGREILRLSLRVKFCISKNIAVIPSECRTGPCVYFFDFVRFYANLDFYARTLKWNFADFVFRIEQ